MIGIYKITNTITNQVYVGSSIVCIEKRWRSHKKDLRSNKHHSQRLQNSWNKYKEESFIFEVLEECEKDKVLEREQYYIDTLNPFFNICRVAGNCTGRKLSEESKKKMSEIKKKQPLPQALIDRQKKIYVDDNRTCSICSFSGNKSLFNSGARCKKCFNMTRPSRSITGAREAFTQKRSTRIEAYKENEVIQFKSMRDTERKMREIYPTFNRTHVRNCILSGTEYFGYRWRVSNATHND